MFHRYIRLAGVAAMLWVAAAQGAPSTDEKIDQLSEELERLKAEITKGKGGDSGPSSGGKTTIGGYGELHYNNLDSKKEIDFHRFVLFFGHKFSDRIRFHSEVEIEHAFLKDNSGTSSASKGEVEIEQAYIEFDLNQRHRALAGLFLVPVGILNETHEPPAFYGVERNAVENRIIPSTWWEAGVGFKGDIGAGFGYDLAVTSGLQIATTGALGHGDSASQRLVRGGPAGLPALHAAGRVRRKARAGFTDRLPKLSTHVAAARSRQTIGRPDGQDGPERGGGEGGFPDRGRNSERFSDPPGAWLPVAVHDHDGLGRERAFILPISRTGADKESKTWMQRPKLRTWVGFS